MSGVAPPVCVWGTRMKNTFAWNDDRWRAASGARRSTDARNYRIHGTITRRVASRRLGLTAAQESICVAWFAQFRRTTNGLNRRTLWPTWAPVLAPSVISRIEDVRCPGGRVLSNGTYIDDLE